MSALESKVQNCLTDLRDKQNIEPLKKLFLTHLNYDRVNKSISTRSIKDSLRDKFVDDPTVLAESSESGDFKIIYTPLHQLSKVDERAIVDRLLPYHHYSLFVFSNRDKSDWRFLNVKYDDDIQRRKLYRRITVGQNDRLRTATERIALLDLATLDSKSPLAIQQQHDRAFDVEAVTDKFFEEYKRVFEQVERQISGITNPDAKRLFAQKLFNRLMFIAFIEKKGWLEFGGRTDYLDALWDNYQNTDSPAGTLRERSAKTNFYRDRLSHLFFSGLNNHQEQDIASINGGGFLKQIIGKVPFLNGGLFEQERDEINEKISIPDDAIELIFTDLFAKFNFTVSESTPLDEEVAVDPEMLGKVFEELCNSRHDSGSYYTPKPIVSFMCREALKGYLNSKVGSIESPPLERGAIERDAIAKFVDDRDASQLRDPEAILKALKEVTVCDPACGSGAYLLGMLHELLDLRECLFSSKKIGSKLVYDRKLEIIEHNLYGVDKEQFAINIARLRLWLSLAVDSQEDKPEPLPNLKYKLEVGDSLLAPIAMAQLSARDVLIPRYRELKAKYINEHYGSQKKGLVEEIEKIKSNIATLTHGNNSSTSGFDWAVEFAEVMADGGFDIQVANPPYVRQEKIVDLKLKLEKIYPDIYNGRSDLCCYFYARSLQLLKPDGMLAFISSNKWFRSGYGSKLREHISKTCQIYNITDFGELPVFKDADTFPMIFIARQKKPEFQSPIFTKVKSLSSPYPDISFIIYAQGFALPQNAIKGKNWTLNNSNSLEKIQQMKLNSTPLNKYVKVQIYSGIKTGYNPSFWIDGTTRNAIIHADQKSSQIIKRLVRGKDIRKWYLQENDLYLIYTNSCTNIEDYPAIKEYLSKFRNHLENRAGSQPWWQLQQAQNKEDIWERKKIIYPDICKESRFTFDEEGIYADMKGFILASSDLYLLGILNSKLVWWYLQQTCAVLGDAESNGRLQLKKQYIDLLPIPQASDIEKKAISKLVQKCLDAKGVGCEKWEREIDVLVGRLYGFGDNHDLN